MPPLFPQVSTSRTGFTLVELLATIAILAVLVAVIIPIVSNYVQTSRHTADHRTFIILNDALTRYKTQGGSLSALTSGASIGNVLRLLQTPLTWAGVSHQFLKSGTTYSASSLSAEGTGHGYIFTTYGSYTNAEAYARGIASSHTINDEASFTSWFTNAVEETRTTNFLALTNPDTTQLFGIYARVANSGDKVRIWWDDGTTSDYDSISTSSETTIAKDYGSAAARTIVIVGNISYIWSKDDAGLGGSGATYFGGDISTMKSLTFLNCTGSNTLSGSISGLTGMTYLDCWGNNTLSGSVSSLTQLTWIAAYGNNTIGGDIGGLSQLQHLHIGASNSLYGDVSATSLEYINCHGNSSLSGDVSSLSNLGYLSCGGTNTLSGDISSLTNLGTIYCYGSNTLSGDISSLINLTYLNCYGDNTLSGDVSGLSNLGYISVGGYNTITGI